MVVDCARDKNIPIRIGVNAGSLEKDLQEKYGEPTPQALLESAMRHVDHLDRLNFDQFKVSVKASDVFLAVESYRLLAKQIDQPLHLGITEAGGARSGAVKSAIGLGLLLSEGIGDTLRVSLAADPVEEIKVGFDILKSLRIRSRGSTSSPARPVRVRNLMLSVRLTRWSNARKISSLRWTFRLSAAW